MGHQELYSRTGWWFLTARFGFVTIAMIVKVRFQIENNSRTLAQSNPDIPPSHQVFSIQYLYKYCSSHHRPILLNSQDSYLLNVITNGSFYKRIIQHHICKISHSHTFPSSSKLLRPVGGGGSMNRRANIMHACDNANSRDNMVHDDISVSRSFHHPTLECDNSCRRCSSQPPAS